MLLVPHLLHNLACLPSKDVVHNAGAVCVVVQARQQGAYACCCVCRVQLLNLLVWQLCQLVEKLSKVEAHVGVGAIPHSEIRHLQDASSPT